MLVLGVLVFFVTRTSTTESVTDTGTQSLKEEVLSLTRTYEDGVVTVAGAYRLPSVCDSLVSEAGISSTGDVEVRLTHTVAEGACLMRVTNKPFSVSVEAAETSVIRVLVNGAEVASVVE